MPSELTPDKARTIVKVNAKEHNPDAKAKRVLVLGLTESGAYVALNIDNDGGLILGTYENVIQTRLDLTTADTWYEHSLNADTKYFVVRISDYTTDYDVDLEVAHTDYISIPGGTTFKRPINPGSIYLRTAETSQVACIEEYY